MSVKDEKPTEISKTDPRTETKSPNPWDTIVEGSTVLAQDKDSDGGFYYAIVEKISADKRTVTCSWKGFPKLPHFTVRRLALGLVAVVK